MKSHGHVGVKLTRVVYKFQNRLVHRKKSRIMNEYCAITNETLWQVPITTLQVDMCLYILIFLI